MATADSGHSPEIPDHDDAPTSDEPWNVLTVPNLVSLLRLCGIPLFLWLVLVEEADLAATTRCRDRRCHRGCRKGRGGVRGLVSGGRQAGLPLLGCA